MSIEWENDKPFDTIESVIKDICENQCWVISEFNEYGITEGMEVPQGARIEHAYVEVISLQDGTVKPSHVEIRYSMRIKEGRN
jgi:hypothetical protein